MANIDWNSAQYPGSYTPVQLDPSQYPLPLGWLDWWSKRSLLCCCCFPAVHCANGRCNPCLAQTVDALDTEIYKKTLEIQTFCPEEMKGVWWLQDNIAHETLVIFNDAMWKQSDDPAIWYFQHDLPQSWSRDPTAFGMGMGTVNAWKMNDSNWANQWQTFVPIWFNFDQGKAFFKDNDWIYRISADEWQKAATKGPPGQPGGDEITYMYRWRKVMRGDGSLTPAWHEMKELMNRKPLNCFDPWCPCWPICVPAGERNAEMAKPNRYQVMIFRPEQRNGMFSGCCCLPPINCCCLCPLFAKVDGAWAQQFESSGTMAAKPPQQDMSEGAPLVASK